jgi:hypothetical protein
MRSRHIAALLVGLSACTFSSCDALKEIQQTLSNLSRCSFKLNGLSNFQLAGIGLDGKTGLDLLDGARALAAFGRGELPASFTLNVLVRNPNDGTSGTTRSAVVLSGFAWNLRLDDTPTISGDIQEPVTIPASGSETVLPLRMKLDLLQFFKDKGYQKILDLAFSLGGAKGSTSRVTLKAKPTVRTDYGTLAYPGEIDIIDTEFRGQ